MQELLLLEFSPTIYEKPKSNPSVVFTVRFLLVVGENSNNNKKAKGQG
jgi:hypothetical protein